MYKVILVDDCATDIEGIKKHIDWAGLNCQVLATASNGDECIPLVFDLKPDIIITDVSMPIMDGIEMTKILQSHTDNLHFIYISCFDEFSYIKSAIDSNVAAYVLKPIKPEELTNAILKVTSDIEKKNSITLLEDKLKKDLKRNLNTLSESFLIDLLFNAEFDEEHADLLNIPYTERFRIAFIYIDKIENLNEDICLNIRTKLYSLKDICIKAGILYTLSFGIQSLILLINENSMLDDELTPTLRKIKNSFEEKYSHTVSIFYNITAFNFSDLSSNFFELNSIAQDCCQFGNNLFIMTNSYSSDTKLNNPNFKELYNNLANVFFSESNDSIKQFADMYFSNITIENISYTKALSVQIINTINTILTDRNESFSNVFGDEFLVWTKLLNINSIQNIKQWIINMLIFVKEYLLAKSVKINKYTYIVEETKNYIETHFASQTIIDDVAESVHLSANHLNFIFKSVTGQTLFSYTVEKRIEKAKELMCNKSLSLSDIAYTVGYSSNSYFTTAFKKRVGITPTQYINSFITEIKNKVDSNDKSF